jgi:hypothetical protein
MQMMTTELEQHELQLIRYALGYLEVSLDPDLTVEAAQEAAPETQQTGEPLPDVRAMIAGIKKKLSFRMQ